MTGTTDRQDQRDNAKFVWESAFLRSGITGNAGFVGMIMATFWNGVSGEDIIWFTHKHLSELTQEGNYGPGLSEKAVRENIKRLMDAGWVERVSVGRVGHASRYRLVIPPATAEDLAGAQRPEIRPSTSYIAISTSEVVDEFDQEACERLLSEKSKVVADTRPEWKQRQQWEQGLGSEGLGPDGTPLEDDERRPSAYRSAYSAANR